MASIAYDNAGAGHPAFTYPDQICAGTLAVRLAETSSEIEAAQALRYRVFYAEMGGAPLAEARLLKRDFDSFDPHCDHLIVTDHTLPAGETQVVGTYRLLRRSSMQKLGNFYSESEFDITAILRERGEILELGRSCVDIHYRNRAVMQLLWRGIAAYAACHNVKLMFGCASLAGTHIERYALPLAYLHHYHMAPAGMRAEALPDRYREMDLMPKHAIDTKAAFAALPALIKGYLRAGGCVGHGAVIDSHCNTIDVSMAVKVPELTKKYAQRYAAPFAGCDR